MRIENIEDKNDSVKFISITSSAFNPTVITSNCKSITAKKSARPRKPRSIKDSQDSSPAK